MENKYIYKSVKGCIEVELDPEWVGILQEMDNEWNRTAHRQDCREISLSRLEGYDGREAYEDDPLSQDVERDEEIEAEIVSEELMAIFTVKEKELIKEMLFKNKKGCKYAEEIGIDKSVVSRRKINIEKKTKSFYENSKKRLILMR